MTMRKLKESEQLDRLADTLVQDILELSNEEVIAEAKEQFGDQAGEIGRLRSVINSALLRASKTKLSEARASVAVHKKQNLTGNVIALSMAQKRTLIESFTALDPELQQKLTLAARKGEGIQSENDIEGMFEDLIELGLIDEEGNPR